MIYVVSQSDLIMDDMHEDLILLAFTEGFLDDSNVAHDAIHFEALAAAKPSEKREIAPKKRSRKSKEECAAWLAEQAEIEANLTTYERKLNAQLTIPTASLWQDILIEPNWASRKIVTVKIRSGTALKDI